MSGAGAVEEYRRGLEIQKFENKPINLKIRYIIVKLNRMYGKGACRVLQLRLGSTLWKEWLGVVDTDAEWVEENKKVQIVPGGVGDIINVVFDFTVIPGINIKI